MWCVFAFIFFLQIFCNFYSSVSLVSVVFGEICLNVFDHLFCKFLYDDLCYSGHM